jgi:23S rRNA (guanosine2251-2'-O)-methyltransferase
LSRNPHRRDELGGQQVEGRRAVLELLSVGRRQVHQVMIAEGLDRSRELDEIRRLAPKRGARLVVVPSRRVDAEARSFAHQGVLARAAPLPSVDLEALSRYDNPSTTPFLVVLDGITDPQNVGAVLRSAECAGVTGVVMGRHRSVHVTPTVAKAAAGAVEHLDICLVPGIPAAIARMRELGVRCIGLDSDAERRIYEFDLGSPPGPVALVLGDEGRGLGHLTRSRCDELATIPLRGSIGSLNVAAAAAVACFELARRFDGARASSPRPGGRPSP